MVRTTLYFTRTHSHTHTHIPHERTHVHAHTDACAHMLLYLSHLFVAMVRATVDKYGRVDILINNAGALWWKDMIDTPIKR